MRVGLLQRIDPLQLLGEGDVERRLLDRFAGRFKPRHAEFAAFEFTCLRRCASSAWLRRPSDLMHLTMLTRRQSFSPAIRPKRIVGKTAYGRKEKKGGRKPAFDAVVGTGRQKRRRAGRQPVTLPAFRPHGAFAGPHGIVYIDHSESHRVRVLR